MAEMAEIQTKKDIDNQIEIAKWSMYGEEWEIAKEILKNAKRMAIQLRDKARIDIILELLRKAENKEKVSVE